MKTWWLRGHTSDYSTIHGIMGQKEATEHIDQVIPHGRLPPIAVHPNDLPEYVPGKFSFNGIHCNVVTFAYLIFHRY